MINSPYQIHSAVQTNAYTIPDNNWGEQVYNEELGALLGELVSIVITC